MMRTALVVLLSASPLLACLPGLGGGAAGGCGQPSCPPAAAQGYAAAPPASGYAVPPPPAPFHPVPAFGPIGAGGAYAAPALDAQVQHVVGGGYQAAPAQGFQGPAQGYQAGPAPAQQVIESAPAQGYQGQAPAQAIESAPAQGFQGQAQGYQAKPAQAQQVIESAPAQGYQGQAPAQVIESAPAQEFHAQPQGYQAGPAQVFQAAPAQQAFQAAPAPVAVEVQQTYQAQAPAAVQTVQESTSNFQQAVAQTQSYDEVAAAPAAPAQPVVVEEKVTEIIHQEPSDIATAIEAAQQTVEANSVGDSHAVQSSGYQKTQ